MSELQEAVSMCRALDCPALAGLQTAERLDRPGDPFVLASLGPVCFFSAPGYSLTDSFGPQTITIPSSPNPLTLTLSGSFTLTLNACLSVQLNYVGPPDWLSLSGSSLTLYENLTANVNIVSSGTTSSFSASTFGSPSNIVTLWSDSFPIDTDIFTFIPIPIFIGTCFIWDIDPTWVQFDPEIDLAWEYAASWNQFPAFDLSYGYSNDFQQTWTGGTWTATNSATSVTGSNTNTISAGDDEGSLIVRAGPEAKLTVMALPEIDIYADCFLDFPPYFIPLGNVLDCGFGPCIQISIPNGVASISAEAFLFAQGSIYLGTSDLTTGALGTPAAPDLSKGNCNPGNNPGTCGWQGPGSCGSGYVVPGLMIQPLMYEDGFLPAGSTSYRPSSESSGIPWAAACIGWGLELGYSWTLGWPPSLGKQGGAWEDYMFGAEPILATVTICNVGTGSGTGPGCTPTFTGSTWACGSASSGCWNWNYLQQDVWEGGGLIPFTPILSVTGGNIYTELPTVQRATPYAWAAGNVSKACHGGGDPYGGPQTDAESSGYCNCTSYPSGYDDGFYLTATGAKTGVSFDPGTTGTVNAPVEDMVAPNSAPPNYACDFDVAISDPPLPSFVTDLAPLDDLQISQTFFAVTIDPPGEGSIAPALPSDPSVPVAGPSPPSYPLTVEESGLPAGLTFGVNLSGTSEDRVTDGGVDNLTFSEPNGTYSYLLGPIPGYSSVWAPVGTQSVTVNGTATTIDVLFQPTPYAVWFNVTGFPRGAYFNATLGGQMLSFVSGANAFMPAWGELLGHGLTNGTYAYQVTPVPGYTAHWNGNLTVAGHDVLVNLSLTPADTVTYTETGLPSGSQWLVAVGSALYPGSSPAFATDGNSTGASISLAVPPGSYPYLIWGPGGYQVSGMSPVGNLTVTGSSTVQVTFVKATTPSVVFSETGLPRATGWCVSTVVPICTNASSITVALGPGVYPYRAVAPSGYTLRSSEGWFHVSTGTVKVALKFSKVPTAKVTFIEKGLPRGTTWSVSLTGATNDTPICYANGTSRALSCAVDSGSYDYTVAAYPYTATPSSGTVTAVAPKAQTVKVVFAKGSEPKSIPVGPTPFGVAVDAANGYVYVTNSGGSNNVSVING